MTLRDISEFFNTSVTSSETVKVTGISIDSRTLEEGMLFFAIRGEHYDGHDYIQKAFEAGASAVVAEKKWTFLHTLQEKPIITVENTLQSLQELALSYRKQFSIPVVGITGSNGKTTTKEMIALVLSSKFRVLKTQGNKNNHIGVPLTICEWDRNGELAVLEMGTNHFGEIQRLCEIAQPTHGVLTNIGKGHLEFFGDLEGVLKAKSEMLDYMHDKGPVFINGDDPCLTRVKDKVQNSVLFGFSENCDIKATAINVNRVDVPAMRVDDVTIQLSVPGYYNLYNALAAVAVGLAFEVPWSSMQEALESYCSIGKRSELIKSANLVIFNDSYNANPTSMENALKTFKSINGLNRRVAILGDMLELGESSREEHQHLGDWIVDLKYDAFFSYGSEMRYAAEQALLRGARGTIHFEKKADLIQYLLDWITGGDGIIVKGSRGMQMEDVVEAIQKKFNTDGQQAFQF